MSATPALAALCRALESVFSAHFQTNVYLSPPNAQGFGTHFDSHDVFVLQISGSKTWSLYDTLIELPLHEQRFEKGKHIPGPVTQQLTIRAGDLLYCPRGLFHSAHSTDEPSLHVTLGLMGKTWADVLAEAVSAASLAHPALRANLPVGFANPGFDMKGASDTFRSLLESFVRCVQVGPMLERFATDFTTSRRPDFRGLLQDQTITLDSKVSPGRTSSIVSSMTPITSRCCSGHRQSHFRSPCALPWNSPSRRQLQGTRPARLG
jgi:hypothetical protein